jgi:ADP-heptose:LPS heptosyltransferase
LKKAKILVLRLSSFGDIIQALSTVVPLKKAFPSARIDWVARAEFVPMLNSTHQLDQVWPVDRAQGLWGLIRLGWSLRKQGYTHLYDAHRSMRSRLLSWMLWSPALTQVSRSKDRLKRILLFTFRLNTFPKPYRGMNSYLAPLEKWGVEQKAGQLEIFTNGVISSEVEGMLPSEFITLVPSAAWPMKRWPIDYWKQLMALLPEQKFVILGGPEDHFCEEIQLSSPSSSLNLAGKLSFEESCLIVQRSKLVVSADTGLLHVADLTGKAALALLGPTAFGHPTGHQVKTMEVELPCRPCTKDGRGRCSQSVYQRCMVEITPENVAKEIRSLHPQ